jgi:hypothetical protein
MSYHLPRRSRSLREIQASSDTFTLPSNAAPLTKSPSLANLAQPATTSRYQLWPASRSPVGQQKNNNASFDKIAALSVGRSSTSLSDTAVLPESVPFWQRTSALARRRKVSVPELGNTTMTTVQEMAIDSRESDLIIMYGTLPNTSKLRFQADHLCVSCQMRLLVMRGPAAHQAQTGELVPLAMPWFLVSQAQLPCSTCNKKTQSQLQMSPSLR